MENYTHSALKIVVAQMCQVLGWHAMQPVTLEILVDLLHRYLMKLGSTTCEYSLLANRTEPNLEDLFSTFHHMRINLEEMRSFVQHVEMPRSLANFPFKQKAVSKLKFDHCTSSDTYVCSPNERLQCVPSYMPPLSESSKEQREEDEESGFGDLSELDLQVGAHREETVGSHAEPPAPRPASSSRSSSPRHDPTDDGVASKLETDLRLSEDEVQEPEQLIDSHSPVMSYLHSADVTPTSRHQTGSDLTFEPLPYSSPADYPSGVGDDWSNPPVTVEISASQVLSPEDGVESADTTDSTSSDTDNEKIELILPETNQVPSLAPNTPRRQTSPAHTPIATPGESHTFSPTHTHSATPVPTPDRIREGSKKLDRLRRESEQRLERIGRSETCLDELITQQWDYTTETKHEMSVSEVKIDSLKNSVRLVLDKADTRTYPAPPATLSSDLGTQSQATLPFKKRLRPSHEPLGSTSSYDINPNEGDRPPIRLSLSLKKTDAADSGPLSPLPVSIPLSTLSRHSPVKMAPKIKVKTPNKRPTIQPNHISVKKMKLSTDSVSDSHITPLLVSIPLSKVTLLPPATLVSEHSSDLLDDTSSLQDPFPEVTSSQSEVREELLSTPKSHKSKLIKSTPERSRKSSTSPKKLWSVVSIPLHKLKRKPVHPCLRVESSLTSEVSSIERVDIGVGGHHEYLCPKCKNGYDGSLMICCDGNCTDTWYHGKCVGIFQAPESHHTWYCPECRSNQNTSDHRKHKKHKKHRKFRQSYSEPVSDTEQYSSPSLTQ